MRRAATVLVAGPFGAGKTTFIRTVSEKFVTAERGLTGRGVSAAELRLKRTTTVFADIGVASLDGRRLLLYGAPGQSRFSFTIRALAARCRHLIFLVDTSDRAAVYRSRLYFDRFMRRALGGFESWILALNKRDISSLARREVLEVMGVEAPIVVDLVALDRESCLAALRALLAQGGELA
ncbi:MAG: hypothetical protein DRK00_05665 [Thermoprotei archaeon]|nr:MAG: hypothetical protein DRK00_05665 [Thermoprotei archaeon]